MHEYKVIMDANHDLEGFTQEVTEAMKAGWELRGGIAVHSGYLYQAMERTGRG